MIWLLLLVAVCGVTACTFIGIADDVTIQQEGVSLESDIKTKKGDTEIVPPED